MALDYIPSYIRLRNTPKLRKLAADLGISRAQAIGHLHLLWWFAAEQAGDGDLTHLEPDDIAFASDWEGDAASYVTALTTRGWLEHDPQERLIIHDWYDFGGKAGIASAGGSWGNHKRWHLDRHERNTSCGWCRDGVDSDPSIGATRGESLEEKRREETRTDEKLPSSTRGDFDAFWAIYPRRQGKRAAEAAFVRAVKRTDVATICAGAARYRDDPNRDPGYTAHPTTWLNRDGWDDEPMPARSNGHVLDSLARDLVREVNGNGRSHEDLGAVAPRSLSR